MMQTCAPANDSNKNGCKKTTRMPRGCVLPFGGGFIFISRGIMGKSLGKYCRKCKRIKIDSRRKLCEKCEKDEFTLFYVSIKKQEVKHDSATIQAQRGMVFKDRHERLE
jgi:hypothetical protein